MTFLRSIVFVDRYNDPRSSFPTHLIGALYIDGEASDLQTFGDVKVMAAAGEATIVELLVRADDVALSLDPPELRWGPHLLLVPEEFGSALTPGFPGKADIVHVQFFVEEVHFAQAAPAVKP